MATPTTRKLTYADYERIPEDGRRHEIIGGEEHVTPAPNVPHQAASRDLAFGLHAHVSQNGLGEVFYAPIDVLLSDTDIVQPDIVFVSTERRAIVGAKNIQGAPDLVVEILSRSTAATDRGAKLDLDARSGVLEYWILDAAARSVEVHVFGATPRRVTHGADATFESPLLPGLVIRLADVLSRR